MKKRIRNLLSILLSLVLLCGGLTVPSVTTEAKEMEECYHCGKTGEFHCDGCNNTGTVVCDGCGGGGHWVCPGQDDKGPCNNGWYTCPSCNGDGLSRPIPADGNAGPCGNCGGSGKLECVRCHGQGGGDCDRCHGTGRMDCPRGDCQLARQYGYKCPYCKGTGFLGVGAFKPEWNDGVHNVPEVGDHIITDAANWRGYTYGGDPDPDPVYPLGRDPKTGRDYVWFIDLGSGTWEVGGRTITAFRNGATVSGVVDLKYNDPLQLNGINDLRGAQIFLVTSDGIRIELKLLNGDGETSVATNVMNTDQIPFKNLSIVIEYTGSGDEPGPDEPGPGPDVPGPDEPGPGPDEPEPGTEKPDPEGSKPAWYPQLPGNRNSDFDIPLPNNLTAVRPGGLRVEMGPMNATQKKYYEGLSDNELLTILRNVQQIVMAADPGRSDPELDALLEALARRNGFDSLQDGRLYPLYFEGHQEVGFPVHVSVHLRDGDLDGGNEMFVYHVAADGHLEFLGSADYGTYEDGFIEQISFYTASFSYFFTSKQELKLDIENMPETREPGDEPSEDPAPIGGDDPNTPNPPISGEPGNEPQGGNEANPPEPTKPADMSLVPKDRKSDFEIPVGTEGGRPVKATAPVEINKMTETEQLLLVRIPEKDLAQTLTNVRSIVESAEPGKTTPETEQVLNAVAAENGYTSIEEGKIYPLYFEGHQEIGFPVRITVQIEKGTLSGVKALFVYHIRSDRKVESLGKADIQTADDGSVESISFYTDSFSSFFTSEQELKTDVKVNATDPVTDQRGEPEPDDYRPILPILIGAGAGILILVIVIVVILSRKKRKAGK